MSKEELRSKPVKRAHIEVARPTRKDHLQSESARRCGAASNRIGGLASIVGPSTEMYCLWSKAHFNAKSSWALNLRQADPIVSVCFRRNGIQLGGCCIMPELSVAIGLRKCCTNPSRTRTQESCKHERKFDFSCCHSGFAQTRYQCGARQ